MDKLRLLTIVVVCGLSGAAFGQSSAVKNCEHEYMCPGVEKVTISKMTPAELKKLKDASDRISMAEEDYRQAEESVVKAHGGYVISDCHEQTIENPPYCAMTTGERQSDIVEIKGNFLILEKHWIPEL